MLKPLCGLIALLAHLALWPSLSLAESKLFDVDVESVEAFILDSSTGELSSNIVESDSSVFRRRMTDVQGYSTPLDVLIRVRLRRQGNGNIQPDVHLVVLENFDQDTVPPGGFVRVMEWLAFREDTLRFDRSNIGTITSLIRRVTCSKIDIIVKTGGEGAGAITVRLPFECKQ